MRWAIRGQLNDVGGSLVHLGIVEGEWNRDLRERAHNISLAVDSVPELTNVWVTLIDENDKEIIQPDGMLLSHDVW